MWNRRAGGWISVKDRLPHPFALVLINYGYSGHELEIDIACLNERGGWNITDATVYWWMPIPMPPEVSE